MKLFRNMRILLVTLLLALCFSNISVSHAESIADGKVNENGEITVKINITEEMREECEKAGVRLENIIDVDNPVIVLDSDDLAAIEENNNTTVDESKIPSLAQLMSTYDFSEDLLYQYVTKKHTIAVNQNGGGRAMQNFCYGSDGYLYITQNTKGTVTISRYRYSGSQYIYNDSMTISNAGHAQTLEQFTYGNDIYLLVSLGNNVVTTDEGDKMYWSTQIGCVKYQEGTSQASENLKKYDYLQYANKNQSNFGKTKRVDAALSSDKNRIVIWKKNVDNKIEITGYDFSDFKNTLFGSTATTVSIKKLNAKYSFNNKDDSSLGFSNSFQGIELSNEVNGVSSIYTVGGNEAKSNMPLVIARYNSNGNFKKSYGIKYMDLSKKREMEGIHINGEYLDVGMVPAGDGVDKSTQHISTIDKNVFK